MRKKQMRITEKDYLKACRRASRDEEIQAHGKQIAFRTIRYRSRKLYDRKRLKRVAETDI